MAEQITNEQIAQQLADLKASNEKLAKDNQTISAENQKLMKALNTKQPDTDTVVVKKEDPKLPTQRVRVGEAEYAFQVPTFYHGGFYHTAEELVAAQNTEATKKIVADLLKVEGQGILKLIK